MITGTVARETTEANRARGYSIFYAMVNVGGSFGPIVAGKLRVISWDYTFYAAAAAIGLMLLVTIFFYKEPPRQLERGAPRGAGDDHDVERDPDRFAHRVPEREAQRAHPSDPGDHVDPRSQRREKPG